MKILVIKRTETNNFYDAEKTRNGGGYSQPEYEISFDDQTVWYVKNYSCGEFGTRYYASVVEGYDNKTACWGTMIQGQEDWTYFTEEDREKINLVEEAIDIKIPISGDGD